MPGLSKLNIVKCCTAQNIRANYWILSKPALADKTSGEEQSLFFGHSNPMRDMNCAWIVSQRG